MKTKEEVIKEAWGSYWKDITNEDKGFLLRNDGWLPSKSMQYLDIINQDHFEWKEIRTFFNDEVSFSHLRPQSLEGIETNHGWNKIESKDDLPDDGYYFVMYKNGKMSDCPKDSEFEDDNYWLLNITHYQPVIKPLPPLY